MMLNGDGLSGTVGASVLQTGSRGSSQRFGNRRRILLYAPAYPDTPARAYIADCWGCDEFGRIDPGLKVSPIPVRHEDLGPIVNVIVRDSA